MKLFHVGMDHQPWIGSNEGLSTDSEGIGEKQKPHQTRDQVILDFSQALSLNHCDRMSDGDAIR